MLIVDSFIEWQQKEAKKVRDWIPNAYVLLSEVCISICRAFSFRSK